MREGVGTRGDWPLDGREVSAVDGPRSGGNVENDRERQLSDKEE